MVDVCFATGGAGDSSSRDTLEVLGAARALADATQGTVRAGAGSSRGGVGVGPLCRWADEAALARAPAARDVGARCDGGGAHAGGDSCGRKWSCWPTTHRPGRRATTGVSPSGGAVTEVTAVQGRERAVAFRRQPTGVVPCRDDRNPVFQSWEREASERGAGAGAPRAVRARAPHVYRFGCFARAPPRRSNEWRKRSAA